LRGCSLHSASEVAVLEDDVKGVHRGITYGSLAYVDIAEGDIVEGLCLCALKDDGCCTGTLAGYVRDVNIVNVSEVMVVCSLACIHGCDIEEVFYLAKLATVEVDIVDEATSVGVCLDVEPSLDIACIVAVFDEYISYSCAHFRTYHHSVQTLEMAVANDDVL